MEVLPWQYFQRLEGFHELATEVEANDKMLYSTILGIWSWNCDFIEELIIHPSYLHELFTRFGKENLWTNLCQKIFFRLVTFWQNHKKFEYF